MSRVKVSMRPGWSRQEEGARQRPRQGWSGRAIQLVAQLDWQDAVCLQERSGRIDSADSPAELGEMLASSPAKLGTVRVIEILQYAVEQVLGRHGGIAAALGVGEGELQRA